MTSNLIDNAMLRGGSTTLILTTALLLVLSLIAKETITAAPDPRARPVGRVLDVALIPLLIVFAAIMAVRILPGAS